RTRLSRRAPGRSEGTALHPFDRLHSLGRFYTRDVAIEGSRFRANRRGGVLDARVRPAKPVVPSARTVRTACLAPLRTPFGRENRPQDLIVEDVTVAETGRHHAV